MNSFRKLLKDNTDSRLFRRGSVFILVNACMLCTLYFIIRNMGHIAATAGSALGAFASACTPLIIGLIIAYLISPLADFIDKKLLSKVFRLPSNPDKASKRASMYHFVSVLLALLIVLAAVFTLIYGFVFLIISQIPFDHFPKNMEDFTAIVADYESAVRQWITVNLPDTKVSWKFDELSNKLLSWISNNFSATGVIKTISGFGGGIVNTVIGIIISIYLMKDKDLFIGLWNKFLLLILPEKKVTSLNGTLNEVNGVLSSFVRGALLDSVIIATLSSIGLSILGIEGAVFIGIFAGIANVIPYFGPVLGMVPAFIMGFATSGLWHGVIAVAILLFIQQIDSNLIYPKIVGKSTGLHPLAVLMGITVFGYFWGILGMLLAVPACGVISIFIRKWVNWRKHKIEMNKE